MIPAETPIWTAFVLAGSAMSVIVLLRYFLASGFFAWLTHVVRPGLYQQLGPQIRREVTWSVLATFIYGLPTGAVFWLWNHHGATVIYTGWGDYPLWYLPLSAIVYLFLQDGWFYWTHRAMHGSPALFRLAHKVHHESRPPTAWTAMSFHPLESISGAVLIPVLVFIIPIHLAMLGTVLAIATLMGVINHLGWEIFPRRLVHSGLGRWLISASHHEKHHEDYRCNYGLYFRFWDRLCGTDRGLTKRFDQPLEAKP